jgi:hypothetical protein
MPKTLKLSDLYVVGKEATIEAPEGSVTVWIQKLSPVEHDTALRRANARRAKTLAISRLHEDGEARDSFTNELFDIAPDRDTVIDFLVGEEVAKIYAAREAELADEEKWSKDDYIQGLKDSWLEEMYDRYVTDPEDEEALKVKSELDRFQGELNKIIEGESKTFRKDFEAMNDDKLTKMATDKLIEGHANMEWLTEYRKCEVWLGTKENAKSKKSYFQNREEVDSLANEVLGQLIEAYQGLSVDVTEGKD